MRVWAVRGSIAHRVAACVTGWLSWHDARLTDGAGNEAMFFAYRTRQRIRIGLAICAAYVLLASAAAAIFPRDGESFASSFAWWLLAIPAGLVAYAALETFGGWGLGLPFWSRMPSWARVLLLVAVISLGAVGAVFVSQVIEGAMAPLARSHRDSAIQFALPPPPVPPKCPPAAPSTPIPSGPSTA